VPTVEQLVKAYDRLQFSPQSIEVQELVKFSQWTRVDPRLGTVLYRALPKVWKQCNPLEVNRELKDQAWPSAFGVLCDQVSQYSEFESQEERDLFESWAKCVLTGVKPAQGELFFFGGRKLGGKLMARDVAHNLPSYKRWGYFSKDLFDSKVATKDQTLISKSQRLILLDKLLKQGGRVKVSDYMDFLEGKISRRIAEMDLKKFPRIKSDGNTKGRYYWLKG
jgi:hypothetical protein